MPIELKMPALSPTMEEGTLAKWLVKEGDTVASGDILAEIETDKATMEFEAVDEGTISKILVPEGTDGVKVGAPIAIMAGEGEDASAAATPAPAPKKVEASAPAVKLPKPAPPQTAPAKSAGDRVKASPLARRLAEAQGIDLSSLSGSGPGGRIIRADLGQAAGGATAAPRAPAPAGGLPSVETELAFTDSVPHEIVKLSNMRRTIARRLTESKQQIPHIYLTLDVHLDALLKLRGELNASLESRGASQDFENGAGRVVLLGGAVHLWLENGIVNLAGRFGT